jgi:hypothetical protein
MKTLRGILLRPSPDRPNTHLRTAPLVITHSYLQNRAVSGSSQARRGFGIAPLFLPANLGYTTHQIREESMGVGRRAVLQGLAAAATIPSCVEAATRPSAKASKHRKILIKAGYVASLDNTLGDCRSAMC